MTPLKRYLGDGVYVEMNEAGQIVLTAEDGIKATNTIYLEPEVCTALVQFIYEMICPRT
jgi:hypothetical protein